METVAKRMYEAMFLVDPTHAASDWEGVNEGIKKILEKFDAEIISMRKWDSRNLAYDINKQSRGTYILCYFKGDGTKNREIERDVQLSEQIMRVLILNAESMTQEDMDRDTPVTVAEKRAEQAVEDAKKRAEEAAEAAQEKAEAESEKAEAEAKQEAESEKAEAEAKQEADVVAEVQDDAEAVEEPTEAEAESEPEPAAEEVIEEEAKEQ